METTIAQAQPDAQAQLHHLIGTVTTGLLLGVCTLMVIYVVVALAPALTSRMAYAMRSRSAVCLLAGLGATFIVILGAAVLQAAPALAALWLTLGLVLAVLGFASTAENLGRKIYLVAGKDVSRVTHILVGWPVYFFASMVPVIGWFLIFPYGLVAGVGSIFVGLFVREETL
jgi:hypothetical protein